VVIRIERRDSEQGVTVKLHGWLSEEMLGELDRSCGFPAGRLVLDISQLMGVDEAGLRALRGRAAAGARLVGASPYIRLLLEGGD
jgi:hypothetical protein